MKVHLKPIGDYATLFMQVDFGEYLEGDPPAVLLQDAVVKAGYQWSGPLYDISYNGPDHSTICRKTVHHRGRLLTNVAAGSP